MQVDPVHDAHLDERRLEDLQGRGHLHPATKIHVGAAPPEAAPTPFGGRAAAVSAGHALAIKSGASPADAASYAQTFADAAAKTGSVAGAQRIQVDRNFRPHQYSDRAAAAAAGRALAVKGGASAPAAARYAQSFADAAEANGSIVSQAALAQPAQPPAQKASPAPSFMQSAREFFSMQKE